MLAATQNPTNFEWFQGTADAVRQYDYLFQEYVDQGVEHFIILSGVHSPDQPFLIRNVAVALIVSAGYLIQN